METEVDEPEPDHMDEDEYERIRGPTHSDAGSDDEEYQEALTPSPEPSPSPPSPSFHPATFIQPPRTVRTGVRMGTGIDPVTYAELEKVPGRISGVKVEDALLLLGFHHHVVH